MHTARSFIGVLATKMQVSSCSYCASGVLRLALLIPLHAVSMLSRLLHLVATSDAEDNVPSLPMLQLHLVYPEPRCLSSQDTVNAGICFLFAFRHCPSTIADMQPMKFLHDEQGPPGAEQTAGRPKIYGTNGAVRFLAFH